MQALTCAGGIEYHMTEDTRDRIIRAAIELVDEKGYKGATTRAIAERAEVNEVTLFRQFGNKQGILDAAIEKYSYFDMIDNIMNHDVKWDLEKDLRMLSSRYQEIVESKRKIILISLREEGRFPELDEAIAKLPNAYKKTIANYFKEMVARGKMPTSVDADVAATNFLLINFGYFFLKERLSDGETEIPVDRFTEDHIGLFIKSIK